jgi:hypothetical protein
LLDVTIEGSCNPEIEKPDQRSDRPLPGISLLCMWIAVRYTERRGQIRPGPERVEMPL